jgi:glyoxylase-like metal-dependent hydrolase (beta-lactamase superfamily II)
MNMLRRTLMVAVVTTALVGCTKAPTTRQLVADAVTTMGGTEALRGIQHLQMKGGQGTRFRHGQTPTIGAPEPPLVLTTVIETADLATGRAALDYSLALPGFTQHRQEVLTKKGAGLVGLENVEGRPLAVMSPSGLFSWGTQNSPDMLLRRNVVSVLLAAAESAAEEAPQNRDLDGVMLKFGRATLASGEGVGLYFDPATRLLTAYEITDTDTMLGDVPARYLLADYKDVGGVTLPHTITITKGGQPYSEVRFTSASINDPSALSVFAIPDAAQVEVDAAIAVGDYSPVTLVKVADGVMLARAYSHNSLVVEFPTSLAVVEAPYTEAQSKTLVRLLAAQFPGKPIRYVAVTHHHYDHTGGVRGLAAEGATVLVDQGHDPPLRALLSAPHTNPPDGLENRRRSGQPVGSLESFNGMKTITEGPQSLQLHAILENPHVTPMVIAYVPSSRVVFQSDIWFPGLGVPGSPDSAHLLKSIQSLGLRVDTHVGGHGGIGSHDELVKAVAGMPAAAR